MTFLQIDKFVLERSQNKPEEAFVHRVLLEALSKEEWFLLGILNNPNYIYQGYFEVFHEEASTFLKYFGYNPVGFYHSLELFLINF